MLGLEIPRQSQVMKLILLLLVPSLELTEAGCCLLRLWAYETRPAIHMEKQLEWAHTLVGAESLWIPKAGQTVLCRLMESQIWYHPAGSMTLQGEGSENGQWHLLAQMPDMESSPYMSLVPFKLQLQLWSSELWSVSVGESVCGFFKRTAWGSNGFFHQLNPRWFLQPEVVGTYLPDTETLGWDTWCEVKPALS